MLMFAIVDIDSHTAPDILNECAEAITLGSIEFSRTPPNGWGGPGYVVRHAPSIKDVLPGEIVIGLFSHPDAPGALGYHTTTPQGHPLVKIFPLLLDDPSQIAGVIDHEVKETAGDPECQAVEDCPDGWERMRELCDACEMDSLSVKLSSGKTVLISDHVLPAWFGEGTGPYDAASLCKSPYELRPGGYINKRLAGGDWQQQVNGDRRAYREKVAEHGRVSRKKECLK